MADPVHLPKDAVVEGFDSPGKPKLNANAIEFQPGVGNGLNVNIPQGAHGASGSNAGASGANLNLGNLTAILGGNQQLALQLANQLQQAQQGHGSGGINNANAQALLTLLAAQQAQQQAQQGSGNPEIEQGNRQANDESRKRGLVFRQQLVEQLGANPQSAVVPSKGIASNSNSKGDGGSCNLRQNGELVGIGNLMLGGNQNDQLDQLALLQSRLQIQGGNLGSQLASQILNQQQGGQQLQRNLSGGNSSGKQQSQNWKKQANQKGQGQSWQSNHQAVSNWQSDESFGYEGVGMTYEDRKKLFGGLMAINGPHKELFQSTVKAMTAMVKAADSSMQKSSADPTKSLNPSITALIDINVIDFYYVFQDTDGLLDIYMKKALPQIRQEGKISKEIQDIIAALPKRQRQIRDIVVKNYREGARTPKSANLSKGSIAATNIMSGKQGKKPRGKTGKKGDSTRITSFQDNGLQCELNTQDGQYYAWSTQTNDYVVWNQASTGTNVSGSKGKDAYNQTTGKDMPGSGSDWNAAGNNDWGNGSWNAFGNSDWNVAGKNDWNSQKGSNSTTRYDQPSNQAVLNNSQYSNSKSSHYGKKAHKDQQGSSHKQNNKGPVEGAYQQNYFDNSGLQGSPYNNANQTWQGSGASHGYQQHGAHGNATDNGSVATVLDPNEAMENWMAKRREQRHNEVKELRSEDMSNWTNLTHSNSSPRGDRISPGGGDDDSDVITRIDADAMSLSSKNAPSYHASTVRTISPGPSKNATGMSPGESPESTAPADSDSIVDAKSISKKAGDATDMYISNPFGAASKAEDKKTEDTAKREAALDKIASAAASKEGLRGLQDLKETPEKSSKKKSKDGKSNSKSANFDKSNSKGVTFDKSDSKGASYSKSVSKSQGHGDKSGSHQTGQEKGSGYHEEGGQFPAHDTAYYDKNGQWNDCISAAVNYHNASAADNSIQQKSNSNSDNPHNSGYGWQKNASGVVDTQWHGSGMAAETQFQTDGSNAQQWPIGWDSSGANMGKKRNGNFGFNATGTDQWSIWNVGNWVSEQKAFEKSEVDQSRMGTMDASCKSSPAPTREKKIKASKAAAKKKASEKTQAKANEKANEKASPEAANQNKGKKEEHPPKAAASSKAAAESFTKPVEEVSSPQASSSKAKATLPKAVAGLPKTAAPKTESPTNSPKPNGVIPSRADSPKSGAVLSPKGTEASSGGRSPEIEHSKFDAPNAFDSPILSPNVNKEDRANNTVVNSKTGDKNSAPSPQIIAKPKSRTAQIKETRKDTKNEQAKAKSSKAGKPKLELNFAFNDGANKSVNQKAEASDKPPPNIESKDFPTLGDPKNTKNNVCNTSRTKWGAPSASVTTTWGAPAPLVIDWGDPPVSEPKNDEDDSSSSSTTACPQLVSDKNAEKCKKNNLPATKDDKKSPTTTKEDSEKNETPKEEEICSSKADAAKPKPAASQAVSQGVSHAVSYPAASQAVSQAVSQPSQAVSQPEKTQEEEFMPVVSKKGRKKQPVEQSIVWDDKSVEKPTAVVKKPDLVVKKPTPAVEKLDPVVEKKPAERPAPVQDPAADDKPIEKAAPQKKQPAGKKSPAKKLAVEPEAPTPAASTPVPPWTPIASPAAGSEVARNNVAASSPQDGAKSSSQEGAKNENMEEEDGSCKTVDDIPNKTENYKKVIIEQPVAFAGKGETARLPQAKVVGAQTFAPWASAKVIETPAVRPAAKPKTPAKEVISWDTPANQISWDLPATSTNSAAPANATCWDVPGSLEKASPKAQKMEAPSAAPSIPSSSTEVAKVSGVQVTPSKLEEQTSSVKPGKSASREHSNASNTRIRNNEEPDSLNSTTSSQKEGRKARQARRLEEERNEAERLEQEKLAQDKLEAEKKRREEAEAREREEQRVKDMLTDTTAFPSLPTSAPVSKKAKGGAPKKSAAVASSGAAASSATPMSTTPTAVATSVTPTGAAAASTTPNVDNMDSSALSGRSDALKTAWAKPIPAGSAWGAKKNWGNLDQENAEKQRQEAERKRQEEDKAKEREEALEKAEQKAKQLKAEEEKAKLQAELEAKRLAEIEAGKRLAEETNRLEEEAKKKAEIEAARKKAEEEATKKKAEEEAKKKEEAARKQAEAEAKQKAEQDERKRLEAEAMKKEEDEREAMRKREEEERIWAEEQRKRKEEERAAAAALAEQQRLEEEKKEEERLQREEEERVRREEEERNRAYTEEDYQNAVKKKRNANKKLQKIEANEKKTHTPEMAEAAKNKPHLLAEIQEQDKIINSYLAANPAPSNSESATPSGTPGTTPLSGGQDRGQECAGFRQQARGGKGGNSGPWKAPGSDENPNEKGPNQRAMSSTINSDPLRGTVASPKTAPGCENLSLGTPNPPRGHEYSREQFLAIRQAMPDRDELDGTQYFLSTCRTADDMLVATAQAGGKKNYSNWKGKDQSAYKGTKGNWDKYGSPSNQDKYGKQQYSSVNQDTDGLEGWRPPMLEAGPQSWSAKIMKEKEGESDGDLKVEKNLKSLLNKLSGANLESIFQQIIEIIVKPQHVSLLMKEVFQKAITQTFFLDQYVTLTLKLHQFLQAEGEGCAVLQGSGIDFKRILLNQCQEVFNQHLKSDVDLANNNVESEEFEAAVKLKGEIVGNVKFVARLIVESLLAVKIIPPIVDDMFQCKTDVHLECVCIFMRDVGPFLGRTKKGENIRGELIAVWGRIHDLSSDKSTKPRIRFMMKDLLDDQQKWVAAAATDGTEVKQKQK